MKKHRKQLATVGGKKLLVDVPVDDELYKMDNRNEYQQARSKAKDVSLENVVLADPTANVADNHEEAQLLECLHEALNTLDENESLLVQYLFDDGLSEREAALLLNISQSTVTKRKKKILQKLRNLLSDWL